MTAATYAIIAAMWAGIAGVLTTAVGSIGVLVSTDPDWAVLTATGIVVWLLALTIGCTAAALIYLHERHRP